MSNPNYVHTITLYHKHADGTWKRSVHENCFWKSEITKNQTGTDVVKVNTYTVRIPASEVKKGFAVAPGDMVMLGKVKDVISNTAGSRAAEVLTRYKPDAFKVTAAADNTSHLMDKHYRLGG